MNQESRSLLAIGLSVLVLAVWYSYFAPKPAQKQADNPLVQAIQPTPAAKSVLESESKATAKASTSQGKNIPAKLVTIESDLYKVVLSNDGGVPIAWELKKFGKPVNLVVEGVPPLIIKNNKEPALIENPRFSIIEESVDKVVFKWNSQNVEIVKEYKFNPNSYVMDLDVTIKNLGKSAMSGAISTDWSRIQPKAKKSGFLGFLKGPQDQIASVYYVDGKAGREGGITKEGNLYWAGVESRYFLAAVVPTGLGGPAKVSTSATGQNDGERLIKTEILLSQEDILANREITQHFKIYAGPKEIGQLKNAGVNLEKAIDYGWFSFVAVPILHLLKFFYGLIHNYGVAIILLTVFVKLLLHPLTRHSMKSMKAMQTLQPKLKELKEKYKNDRERLNTETMQLFRSNKVNPMGGCLPMALQLPIYIALYKVLWNSIELYRAPFFWFYRDLSAPDPYFITPALLGVFMWLQQKMTPSATADPAQAKMMQIMPIMFTAFMLFLPSGLVVYILVNTVMGVLQQWMTNNDVRFRDLIRGRFPQKMIIQK